MKISKRHRDFQICMPVYKIGGKSTKSIAAKAVLVPVGSRLTLQICNQHIELRWEVCGLRVGTNSSLFSGDMKADILLRNLYWVLCCPTYL